MRPYSHALAATCMHAYTAQSKSNLAMSNNSIQAFLENPPTREAEQRIESELKSCIQAINSNLQSLQKRLATDR
jgi:hypothetical protein